MLQSIRSILAVPAVYRLWSDAVGGSACIQGLVDNYIQPRADDRILDIGCGPGTLVPYLPQTGYLGFDLSSEYIEEAKRRFPNAQFVCDRVSEFSLGQRRSFDLVLGIGIIHHLDDTEAIQLFQIAHDALKPGGKLVTIDGVFTNDQSSAARWLLKKDRGEYIRTPEHYAKIAHQVFDDVRPVVRHDMLRIPYSHLILQCVRSAVATAGKTA